MIRPPSRNVEPPQWGNESGNAKVNFEEAQLEPSMDVCRCVHCNAESSVTVFPDLPKNKWKCVVCNNTNMWKPSDQWSLLFGFDSAQPPQNDDFEPNPNKEMGKLTLDALAKMDRGDVEKMSAGDALDTLVACDDAAGGLNEAIGMAAQKGYNQEFVSGVIADLGKLRSLKQLLTGKLEQEVV